MDREWSQSGSSSYDAERLPRHYCPACTALRYDDDDQCPECGKERRAGGWRSLDDSFDPFLGRILNDRYLCSKQLGRGASSTIYRAESLSVPKRFALKMVELGTGPRELDDQLRTRIEREVRAVGMLRNPHIVRVYEMLEFEGGWVGLVMDHIDGLTIEDLVDTNGPLPVERALRLIRQYANGLSEAHDAGMIHRDIKPANLMVERMPDGEDFAFILDFGVVRLDDEARMTKGFLGTPLFASPEQALMGELDARSDIYSLGATLFYMLTGRAPFERRDSLEALEAHIKQKAPTLAEARPDRVFPSRLECLIADTLKKAPADRPQDLLEFIQVVESVLDHPSDPILDQPIESDAQVDGQYDTHHFDDDLAELGAEATRVGRPASGEFVSPSHDFDERPGTLSGMQPGFIDADGAEEESADEATVEQSDVESTHTHGSQHVHEEARFGAQETNPRGHDRPQTDPEGLESPRSLLASQTIQIMPERHEPTSGLVRETSETVEASDVAEQLRSDELEQSIDESLGVEFARTIRKSAARYDHAVIFADAQNEIWLLDGENVEELMAPSARISAISICDRYVFTGQCDGTIGRFDLETLDFEALYQDVRRAKISALETSRSGDLVVAGSASGRVYMGRPEVDPTGWSRLESGAPVVATAVSEDGGLIAVCRRDETMTILSSENPRAAIARIDLTNTPRSAAFSRDGHLLALNYDDGEVAIFEVMAGRKLSSLPYTCDKPETLYFSQDNVLHGFNCTDGHLCRWNLTVSRPVRFEKAVAH